MKTSILVDRVTKRFGRDFVALNDISFSVRPGEIFGFLGPNGAGKTTTVRILSTLLKPTSGAAFICGLDVMKDAAAVRRRIGYVSQVPTVDLTLTGRENLLMQARFFHCGRRKAIQRCNELLELAGLADRGDRSVSTYSGGMRRRLDLAAGFVNNPEVLFLDEPTLGLDTRSRRHIREYVARLREHFNTTIFMTTHDMQEADSLCDRVAIIDSGSIRALDTPDSLKQNLASDCVYIHLSPGDVRKPEEITRDLSTHPFIKKVHPIENGLAYLCNDGEKAIVPIMDHLGSRNIRPQSVTLKRTTLDDVYVSLTGKELGEQSVPSRMGGHGGKHGGHG
ncbi:MAG: ATP-binding cassette domain-containing protein [Chitinivibrionales bacterium]|nr:ATP-binding cassette domain-containing protein [Chitinivibrionales bacterium]